MIIGGIGTEAYQNGYSYTTIQTKRNISDTIFAKTIEDVKNANDTITSNTSTALDAYHVLSSNKVQDILDEIESRYERIWPKEEEEISIAKLTSDEKKSA